MIGGVEETYQRIGQITYEQGRRNKFIHPNKDFKEGNEEGMRAKNKVPIKNENAEITA